MQLQLDEQDLTDAVCVMVATDDNFGNVEGSEPHLVHDINLFFNENIGFSANATLWGIHYALTQQKLIDAISLYLSAYYSFAVERLMINLQYDEVTKLFGAEVIVTR